MYDPKEWRNKNREAYRKYQKEYNERQYVIEYKREYMRQYMKRPEVMARTRILASKRHREYREKLGIPATRKNPDYDKESHCAGCHLTLPKRIWCPNCGLRMRNKSRYRKKEGVHRY